MTMMMLGPVVQERKHVLIVGNSCELLKKFLSLHCHKILTFINSCLYFLEAEVCTYGYVINKLELCKTL